MNPCILASAESVIIPIIAIGGGLVVGAISIIAGTIRRVAQSKELEQSRREIAAYVAEGSMTADEGERLISAGNSKKNCL